MFFVLFFSNTFFYVFVFSKNVYLFSNTFLFAFLYKNKYFPLEYFIETYFFQ